METSSNSGSFVGNGDHISSYSTDNFGSFNISYDTCNAVSSLCGKSARSDSQSIGSDWSCLNIVESSKNIEDWSANDVIGVKFHSIEDAEKFYLMYSKVMGFSIRKDDLKRNKAGEVVLRKWVCSKQGFRQKQYIEREVLKREPKALTRVGCLASFRVGFDKNSGEYMVLGFVADHTHPLVSLQEVQFLRSHRFISDGDKEQVRSMRSVGINTNKIMSLMVRQAGGFEYVGYTTKDLYNFVDADRKSQILDTDSESTLAFICAKAEVDPQLYCKYTVDKHNRLAHLFWADSRCRLDYSCFGDVLVFDTTYKTNAYKMPFVVFVGANHHHATTVFGCALLRDETIWSYVWVLERFLEAMENKKPLAIITDGDKSMRAAIERLMPEVSHRICCWHLERNVRSNVSDSRFYEVFERCLKSIKSQLEFEGVWQKAVEDLGLQDNQWVSKKYEERERWAEAFFVGKFLAGMRSTQRCEGMHSYMNRFLQSRLKLCEFIRQFDRGLTQLRYNEMKADFDSFNSDPILMTRLHSFERYAADVYTRNMFFKVRKEINDEPLFIVLDKENHAERFVYTLAKYGKPVKKWTVTYCPIDKSLKCSCQLYESVGIPCCHSFCVMKNENLLAIPPSQILKRWTKEAKAYPQSLSLSPHDNLDVNLMMRYGSLNAYCDRLLYYASKTSEGYKTTKQEIGRLIGIVQELWEQSGLTDEQTCYSNVERDNAIKNPPVIKTKGSQGPSLSKESKGRRCGHCKNVGHNKRSCPQRISQRDCDAGFSIQNEETSSPSIDESPSLTTHSLAHKNG